MEPAEQQAALARLAQEPALAELERLLAEFNLFRLLNLSGSEGTHSRILAWLLSPGENHQLGDAFLKSFLAATPLAVSGVDWSAAQALPEWRNSVDGKSGSLDILILDERQHSLCAIENKVWSAEHSEQLTRYRRALEERYPDFDRRYVFLSPRGIPAQDAVEREHWQPVSYSVIRQLVAETAQNFADSLSEEVRAFLRQYANALGRYLLGNEDARVMAGKIYQRHKSAIEFIYTHRGYCESRIKEILKEVIANQADWIEDPHNQPGFTRFFPEEWQRFPAFKTGTGWLRQSNALLLFQFRCQNNTLTMGIAISEGTDLAAREAVDTSLRKIIDPAKRRELSLGHHWIEFALSENILDKSDFEQWDETAIRSKIGDWVSAFAQNQYPQIREAVIACFTEVEASRQS